MENEEQKRELTAKQRLWIQAFMKFGDETFGNKTRSALVAYYPEFPLDKIQKDFTQEEWVTYRTAKQIGWENFTKLDLPIEELMDEAGLSDTFLLQKLREGMEAKKLFGKDAIEYADYQSRNRAVELALRVKQKLIERHDVTSKGEKLDSISNKDIASQVRSIMEEENYGNDTEENSSDPAVNTEQVQKEK